MKMKIETERRQMVHHLDIIMNRNQSTSVAMSTYHMGEKYGLCGTQEMSSDEEQNDAAQRENASRVIKILCRNKGSNILISHFR
jgi:hypothetical protein